MKDIKIKPALNGWIVEVGCKQIVFTDLVEMMTETAKYIKNPKEEEKKYMNNAKNDDKNNSWTLRAANGPFFSEDL